MIATESKARNGWHRDRSLPAGEDRPDTADDASAPNWQRQILDFSAAHPAVWIAGAVTLGVILGCIIKRR